MVNIGSIVGGIICFWLAYIFYRGYIRRIFIFPSIYSSTIYAVGPSGFAFIIMGITGFLPSGHPIRDIGTLIGIFSMIIGVIFSITMPLFLTPFWLRILREKYPNYDRFVFIEEAARHYDEWLERTQTPEGAEKWAEEVIKKRFRSVDLS